MKPDNLIKPLKGVLQCHFLVLVLAGLLSAAPVHAAEPDSEAADAEVGGTDTSTDASADKQADEQKEPTLDERLDALLSETEENEYRETRRCLNTRSYRRVEVLNTEYLLFYKGDRYWLNKLKRPCQSLKWNNLPVFEARGVSSHCQNDVFYATNSMDLQQGIDATGRPRGTYGICYLGAFEQISVEQAALLKE